MIYKKNTEKISEETRIRWLQLIRSENIGANSFWSLLENYKTVEDALEALQDLAHKGGKREIKIAALDVVRRELDQARALGIQYLCAGEKDYPPLLWEMEGTPPLVAVKGNVEIFKRPAVSIVGSRVASAGGLKLTAQFAHDLGKTGFVIVSGFARGIDSVAHKHSLRNGTIAVFAGGVNHIYPPENQRLYEEIIENGGAVLSEMPLS